MKKNRLILRNNVTPNIIVAVDVMGADKPPSEIIKGAIIAAQENIAKILLVGNENVIRKNLDYYDLEDVDISIHHTSEVITMHESPVQACKQKQDASIMLCAKFVAEGKADAYISAGNSGAAMTASLLFLKRIKGVKRPAIATVMPTIRGASVILDIGANVDSKPEHLKQFAFIGAAYMKKLYKKSNPSVGLLNIGVEENKGNELILETYGLLKDSKINFIGNIEGRDIYSGICDVIVCDGFVGNIVLKLSEGVTSVIFDIVKRSIAKTIFRKISFLFLKGAFKEVKTKIEYSEYGGAPLLGTNGSTIICHGSSDYKAIKNAIKAAVFSVENNINREIEQILE